jgi:hypothetical protein
VGNFKEIDMSKKPEKKVETPEVEAPKVEAPKVEAPKVEAPKVKATTAPWGKIGPNGRGSMVDPDTGVRYGVNPVRMSGTPKEGSWFDCQAKAGLLIVIQGPAE